MVTGRIWYTHPEIIQKIFSNRSLLRNTPCKWVDKVSHTVQLQMRSFMCHVNNDKSFDVYVTVHHRYNNINSQLHATIIILLIISISPICFGQ